MEQESLVTGDEKKRIADDEKNKEKEEWPNGM